MVSIDEQLIDVISNLRSIDIIKELIVNGANVNYVTRLNQTPLLIASMYGLTDVCKLLIKNGSNVNYQNKYCYTALMFSTRSTIEIMKLLLESGVDSYSVNALCALNLARKFKKMEHVELLEEHIFQKKLLLAQKRLLIGKLFYSDLGKNLVEEGLYEKISLLV